jgi:ribonucleoside-diphosphate reductase alpha chain
MKTEYHLPTAYQSFIHKSRYSRWLSEENRREEWPETVQRFMNEIVFPKTGDLEEFYGLEREILSLGVMPSMRAMMTAGVPAERDNTCIYNCAFLPVDDPKSFDETMFILLCGTGVGFSVEKHNIDKLPEVPDRLYDSDTTIVVRDSKEGWAKAYRQLLSLLWAGEIPRWDTSRVRPAGAKLKTFGGRASGPEPLEELFRFTIDRFRPAAGRKLRPIEAHDIMCKIGEIVVVGGVRRSAMISLSDLDDPDLARAKGVFQVDEYRLVDEDDSQWTYAITMKKGQPTKPTYKISFKKEGFEAYLQQQLEFEKKLNWFSVEPQRALANNSVSYEETPHVTTFLGEWQNLIESFSGERGIFNREASRKQAAKNGRRTSSFAFGTNPCSEIILRPYQFCNLTEVVVRPTDTIEDLERKVRLATILGTIQSAYTKFPYLRKVWQKNTEEERLLGVSLTGVMDNPLMTTQNSGLEKTLEHLRGVAVDTNAEWASRLGISVSTAVTCVKPSGTVSQLVDSASGIHTRHSPYYIRTVRGDNKDPLTQFLIDAGVPSEPCVMKPDNTTVFSFPMKSPDNALTRNDMTAVEQLEMWLAYQRHWCEHKPSVTVSVKDDEWLEVGAFVYRHFDEMSGVSFLPYDGGTYQQAPYQDCSKEEYQELLAKMPEEINWSELAEYEAEDNTAGAQTMACSGDSCEIVDLT